MICPYSASSVLSIDVLKESVSSLQDVQPIAQDKHVPHSSTHREIWPPEDYRLGVKPGVPRERKKVMVKPVSFKIGHLTMNQVFAMFIGDVGLCMMHVVMLIR